MANEEVTLRAQITSHSLILSEWPRGVGGIIVSVHAVAALQYMGPTL